MTYYEIINRIRKGRSTEQRARLLGVTPRAWHYYQNQSRISPLRWPLLINAGIATIEELQEAEKNFRCKKS